MPDPPDADLLRAFRAGDVDAFSALARRHEGRLLRHARLLLGFRGEPEDAVQEALLSLARNPPDPGDAICASHGIGAWLNQVTRNHCLDMIRSDSRRRDREDAAVLGRPDTSLETPLAAAEGDDTRLTIERTLARLPEDQREAVALRLLDDKSYAEIAAITGRKVGTVGWLISRGMKTLAAHLSPLLNA